MKKLLLLLLFIPLLGFGQNTLKGNVVAYHDKVPLPGASIYNNRTKKQSFSSSSGDFTIKALIGDTISVSYVGFKQKSFKTTTLKGNFVELFFDKASFKAIKNALGISYTRGEAKQEIKDAITDLEADKKNRLKTPDSSFLDCGITDSKCFQKELDQHITANFYYPELGDYFDIQAIVYVNYTIDKKGIVKDIKSNAGLVGVVFEDNEAKNIMSKAFEEAASSIIKRLPKMKPAIIDGVSIDTKFRTPIMYKLSDLGSYSIERVSKLPIVSISIEKVENALKFLKTNSMSKEMFIIEDVPLFPGCERVAKSKRRDCFQKKMNQHIARNFRYPEQAQVLGIQGRVFVQFMIGKDGNISGIRTGGAHSILEREAYRIISLLPKFTPGINRGKAVRVPFSIPIDFRLQ